MIGDYITFSDVQNDDYCPKLKVVALNEGDVYASVDRDPAADLFGPEDIAGIPLTQEILEKNFTRTEVRTLSGTKTHYIESDDFYCVALNEYTDSIWDLEYTNCEAHFPLVRVLVAHVHELQHALRLCGIEKEIIL